MTDKKESSGEFMGVNWITGRKIYLTPEEKAVIKKQKWMVIKAALWLLGIVVLSVTLFVLIVVIFNL